MQRMQTMELLQLHPKLRNGPVYLQMHLTVLKLEVWEFAITKLIRFEK